MFGMGKRRRDVERVAQMNEGGPVRPDGPSDAEVIARAARLTSRILVGPGDLDEVVRDLRAILIRSDAGRAVLGRPLEALGPDPVDVLTGERDAARDELVRVLAARDSMAVRLADAQDERNRVTVELAEWMRAAAEARNERDEATRELVDVNSGHVQLVDAILDMAPESWDGEDAAVSIALGFTREMVARLLALRVPLDKWCERPDGTVWPDARTDPNGFADAADDFRRMHSGCRCKGFGEQTPEHAPSVLCKPRPGDRRCTSAGCSGEGEFGHVHEPVSFDDPWAGTGPDGTARVAAPEWKTIGEGGPEGAYTVHHGRDGVTRTFEDAQHFDTACEDRPHCTIVEHHAVEDVEPEPDWETVVDINDRAAATRLPIIPVVDDTRHAMSGDDGRVTCCGRAGVDIPVGQSMTSDPARVTCSGGPAACGAEIPGGRCVLAAGHPVGPMYPGVEGHMPPFPTS